MSIKSLHFICNYHFIFPHHLQSPCNVNNYDHKKYHLKFVIFNWNFAIMKHFAASQRELNYSTFKFIILLFLLSRSLQLPLPLLLHHA